jgi:hypothetical protein
MELAGVNIYIFVLHAKEGTSTHGPRLDSAYITYMRTARGKNIDIRLQNIKPDNDLHYHNSCELRAHLASMNAGYKAQLCVPK